MDADGLVSIIVPTYNAEKTVLQQSYPHFEFIIVDDASRDRSIEIVLSFRDERIKLIRHMCNQGPAAARNTGIEVAQGRWLAVLDADDQWLPQRLERLVQTAKEPGEGYFACDDLLMCFETPSGLRPWRRESDPYRVCLSNKDYLDLDLCGFLKLKPPGVKPFLPLEHIRRFGLLYTPNCSYGADFEFVRHLFRTALRLRLLKEAFYLYRITPGSLITKTENHKQVVEVYNRSIACRGFSREERFLLERWPRRKRGVLTVSPGVEGAEVWPSLHARYQESLNAAEIPFPASQVCKV